MKFVALILTMIVIFLSFKPGIDLVLMQNWAKQTCCAEVCASTNQSSQEEENKECEGNSCNPFQVCGSCSLFCQSVAFEKSPTIQISTKRQFLYSFTFSSLFIADFWQPPRLI